MIKEKNKHVLSIITLTLCSSLVLTRSPLLYVQPLLEGPGTPPPPPPSSSSSSSNPPPPPRRGSYPLPPPPPPPKPREAVALSLLSNGHNKTTIISNSEARLYVRTTFNHKVFFTPVSCRSLSVKATDEFPFLKADSMYVFLRVLLPVQLLPRLVVLLLPRDHPPAEAAQGGGGQEHGPRGTAEAEENIFARRRRRRRCPPVTAALLRPSSPPFFTRESATNTYEHAIPIPLHYTRAQ